MNDIAPENRATESGADASEAAPVAPELPQTPATPQKKGSLRNVFRWIGRGFKNRPKFTTLLVLLFVVGIVALFVERNLYQHYAVVARAYSGMPILLVLILALTWLTLTIFRLKRLRVLYYIGVLGLGLAGAVWGKGFHDYMTSYLRYNTLEFVDLKKLPLTDHERIIPQAGVDSLVASLTSTTITSTGPNLVRVGDAYEWTAALAPHPEYLGQNLLGKVEEVAHLPAVSASTSLSEKTRDRVAFTEGEYMILSANIDTCVRRSFGPLRFWSYEPSNVVFIKDDRGAWVEGVTLVRWSGWLFPWPEFGGIQIVRQNSDYVIKSSSDYLALAQGNLFYWWRKFSHVVSRVAIGCGEWIPPEEVSKHVFLQGQNIVPYEVTRYNALSLGFQEGFTAKAPGYREGDLQIPNLPADMNQQPFTLFARMAEFGGQDKLYQHVALQPYDPSKQGLSTSYFGPADGIGPVFRLQHYKFSNSCRGVSGVSGLVQDKRPEYDWSKSVPVEHRLYVKELPDTSGKVERRSFWMTSVLTRQEGKGYSTSAAPKLFFTEMCEGLVEQVTNPTDPATWPAELQKAFAPAWAGK